MRHGSLFSGIGGFDLAAEWMGWENVFHCEWNEFGQRVLKYYWPKAESFTDITKTDFKPYANTIDILTGGFPCQPYSSAGKRKGKDDERHLWPQMLRAIREISPRFVVGENVRGLTNWNGGMVFEEVCAELEAIGYQVAPIIIPACGVGAPHRRERVWFVAYSYGADTRNDNGANNREEKEIRRENQGDVSREFCGDGNATDTNSQRCQWERKCGVIEKTRNNRYEQFRELGNIKYQWEKFPTQSPICGGDDGIPTKLDGITFPKWRSESIKGYGNAIVPQVAYQIFKAIVNCDDSCDD
jgi:DNA (cytosine-5)-methyltransferase 1